MRYVIRHKGVLTSPTVLAQALGVTTRMWPSRLRRFRPSYHRDFMFIYPEVDRLWEQDNETRSKVLELRTFFSATKFQQRRMLQNLGLPVPWTAASRGNYPREGKYVVRPLRHWKGQRYRVTDDPNDFREGEEYISSLFPKTREYRVICVKGTPLITLRKKVPEGINPEGPWNHEAGSRFQTVQDVPSCKLSGTDVYTRLRDCRLIRDAHIVGVDVMWSKRGDYQICEFNAAPALEIENNVTKIVEHLRTIGCA